MIELRCLVFLVMMVYIHIASGHTVRANHLFSAAAVSNSASGRWMFSCGGPTAGQNYRTAPIMLHDPSITWDLPTISTLCGVVQDPNTADILTSVSPFVTGLNTSSYPWIAQATATW